MFSQNFPADDSQRSPAASAGRRQFLIAASAASLMGSLAPKNAIAGKPGGVILSPNPDLDLFRVIVDLEVEGNVNLAANPLVSRKGNSKMPMKSKARFDYEERYRRPDDRKGARDGSIGDDPITFVERFYHDAATISRLNQHEENRELRDKVKQTIVRREVLPEVLYAADDYFTREELDLLRLPVSSISMDALLPTSRVHQGTKYRPDRDALASVFNLTSVDASEIEAEVVSLTETEAKIHFQGDADGSVDGVPTILRTVGKLTFNRKLGACTWLAMAVHETRDIGVAEPGFDVAATLKMLRKPMDRPVGLAATRPKVDVTGPIPLNRLYVDLHSDQIGFSSLMDRDWRMMSDVPGTAMMRMVRHDRSVAQCDFRHLPSLDAGKQWTLEAFTTDVKQTLGDQLTELIDADQRVSPIGLRVLRVTAAGQVEGVPIQWVLMHFSDDSGRRMLATFTMEADHTDAFAGADLQLASSLQFTAQKPKPGSRSGEASGEEMADSSKKSSPSPRIADAISRRLKKTQVQSASDLKASDLK